MKQHSQKKRLRRGEDDADDDRSDESDGDVDYSAAASKKKQQSQTKRQGRATINPLASARPKPKSHESLWHVKSGAGYQLFVDYYASQPEGVVCSHDAGASETTSRGAAQEASSSSSSKIATTATTSSSLTTCQGRGLSRAAKRRKKKKGESIEEPPLNSAAGEDAPSIVPLPSSPAPSTRIINARLLEELAAMNKQGSGSSAFSTFVETLTRPLPVMVRVRSHVSSGRRRDLLQELGLNKTNDETASDASLVTLYNPLGDDAAEDHETDDGLPDRSLTLLSIPDAHLLKQPQHASLASLLQTGTTNGTLARQEVGSMLPVLAARAFVNQQHASSKRIRRVLDLCSSPGSKTLQLLEWMMERQRQAMGKDDKTPLKPIIVRANDVNPRRLEELQEALGRSGVLSTTTSHDDDETDSHDLLSALNIKLKYTNQDASRYADTKTVAYDVILADVPCSGDGTVRKDARVLPYWTPRTALGLHELQVDILCRAMQLMAVEGVAVYSTCSLNPIENEAVVAAAMGRMNKPNECKDTKRGGMAFRLMDVNVRQLVPKSLRRRGISIWKVAEYVANDSSSAANDEDDDSERAKLAWYDTYEQAQTAGMEVALPTMWPPVDDGSRQALGLCLRLWPQDLNTGGFFVAMIQRTK